MQKLSTGHDSTLGSYLTLCSLVFGPTSSATKFIEKKISESPKGEAEEVIADESQMLGVLAELHMKGD